MNGLEPVGKLGFVSAAATSFGCTAHSLVASGQMLKIFQQAMIFLLEDGEKAEADDGYVGEPKNHSQQSSAHACLQIELAAERLEFLVQLSQAFTREAL